MRGNDSHSDHRRFAAVFSTRFVVLAVALLLVMGACGDDDSGSDTTGGDTTTTAPSDGTTTTAQATTTTEDMQSVSGGVLRIGTSQEVLTLDIPNYRSTQDIMTGAIVLETLITMDENGELHPLLATEWTQVDDVTYTFTLREGVEFSDGSAFNAAAVEKFFLRAKDALKGVRFYGKIDSIATNGDYEVTFTLSEPYSPFLRNIAYATGGIQSPASLDTFDDEELTRNPVGTGPFVLADWTGSTQTFERNEGYWGDPAPLDGLVLEFIPDDATRIAALENNEIDVVQNPPSFQVKDLAETPGLQVFQGSRAQNYFLAFNHSNPLLQDLNVRRAIAMALDMTQLVDGVSEGLPRLASGFVPPELVMMDTQTIPYDPQGAMDLLADAGYPNGFEIDLSGAIGVVPNDVEMVENIQQQLAQVGITGITNITEYADYSDRLSRHEFGISGLAWAHTGTPDSWFRGVFHSESAANWSAYSNPDADALIDAAATAPSLEEAAEIWAELDQLLVDDVAGVPIYWASYAWAASDKVHDFGYHPLGILYVGSTWLEQ